MGVVHAVITRVQLGSPIQTSGKRGLSALLVLSGFHPKHLLKI
jgi:hypothetical protein